MTVRGPHARTAPSQMPGKQGRAASEARRPGDARDRKQCRVAKCRSFRIRSAVAVDTARASEGSVLRGLSNLWHRMVEKGQVAVCGIRLPLETAK